MEHDYSVEGFVNERFVNGHGTGKIDPKTGTSEMEVTFTSLPDGWDPRTIVLMCCDRALVMASREVGGATSIRRASGGWLSIGRHLHDGGRDSVMYDDAGQILARVRATSETDFRGTTRFDRSRIEAGVSHLRPGRNGIAEIPAFDGVMMQAGPRLVTVPPASAPRWRTARPCTGARSTRTTCRLRPRLCPTTRSSASNR